MPAIKAIATVRDVTAGDDGIGIDYSLDIIDLAWKAQVETSDDLYYYLYPNDDSIESFELADGLAQHAADEINDLLTAVNPALAVCTISDVLVPGYGDPKSAPRPHENIFTGYRERVRRIPRNLGTIVQIANAQDTVLTANHLNDTLRCELQFLNAPDLGNQLEYRLYLYAPPADLTDLDGLDDIILDQVITGPPYILWGRKALSSMHASLQASPEIHGVLGLRRKAIGSTVVPSQAGTISRASIAWAPRRYVRRFYFDGATVPDLLPSFRPDWEDTSAAVRRRLNIRNLGSGGSSNAVTDLVGQAGTNRDYLSRQYVSPPLVAQAISGSFRAQLKGHESNTAANARAQVIMYVVTSSGALRGLLYAGDNTLLTNGDPSAEFDPGIPNRVFPRGGPVAMTLVNALDGDRLVIEFGVRFHNNTTTQYTADIRFGEEGGIREELPEGDNASGSFLVPWLDVIPGVILA